MANLLRKNRTEKRKPLRRNRAVSRSRRVFFEQLEDRRLLAGDFHNPLFALDVNDDGHVNPTDALIVVNKLNTDGSGPISALSPGTLPEAFYDTSKDDILSPLDVLVVVNAINDGFAEAELMSAEVVGPNNIVLSFNGLLNEASIVPESFSLVACGHADVCPDEVQPVEVTSATLSPDGRHVMLTTSTQPAEAEYSVSFAGVQDAEGEGLDPLAAATTFDHSLPRVVSATSTSNTTVVVAFSEPMADSAIDPTRYAIRQTNVNPEAGLVLVTGAAWVNPEDHTAVILTTQSQNELSYTLTAIGTTDAAGNPMLPTQVSQGAIFDPTSTVFHGTPPTAGSFIDTDSDGLTDNEELRGWIVSVTLLDGTVTTRGVTSDPTKADSDLDGLPDGRELALGLDPRDEDTDDDLLKDALEVNVLYSNPTKQDTDGDGFGDGEEHNTLNTSPLIPNNVGANALPALVGATSISNTAVRVQFSEPMSDSALDPDNYRFTIEGQEAGGLNIKEDVAVAGDPGESYTVTFEDLNRENDKPRLVLLDDATIGSDLPGSPVLLNIALTAENTLLMQFNEPIARDKINPNSFTLCRFDGALCSTNVLLAEAESNTRGSLITLTLADPLPHDSGNNRYRFGLTVQDLAGNYPSYYREFNIAWDDSLPDTKPRFVGLIPTSPTSLLLSFTEPLASGADDPIRYRIVKQDANGIFQGEELAVTNAEFGYENRHVILTTAPHQYGATYKVEVSGVTDKDGLAVNSGSFLVFSGSFGASVRPIDSNGAVHAIEFGGGASGGTFQLTLDGRQTTPLPYDISVEDLEATLDDLVNPVRWGSDDDHSAVEIQVQSQSEVTYRVDVFNLRDQAGNPFPEQPYLSVYNSLVEPNSTTFVGTPPGGLFIDTDDDGLSDSQEQRGYVIEIRQADGTVVRQTVTSDPNNADTDDDGIGDFDERHYLINPRQPDTDTDGLTDYQELNEIYSTPFDQDSDGDGLTDGLEHDFFHTSPLFADTDGDQFTDDEEIVLDDRNPLLADLPRVEITIGNVDLRLDVRFDEQNSTGTTTIDSKSVATTLTQSQESSRAAEMSSTTEWFAQVGSLVCVGGGCDSEVKAVGAQLRSEGGGGGSTAATFTAQSSRATQREFASTLSTDEEVSAESVVTRVVEGATIGVAVNLVNASNIAFAIRNIEITALVQDPRDPTSFTPVATLFAASDDPVTIGPISPTRGPFRFSASEAFPELVESLMENPRGMLFRVANYEIEDEYGRNFSFVEQDIHDRTAFLEIDYSGNAPLEKHRVATTSDFDLDGNPIGLTLGEVMQDLLGLKLVDQARDDQLRAIVNGSDPIAAIAAADEIDSSYSTRIVRVKVRTDPEIPVDDANPTTFVEVDREILHRVKDVSSELSDANRKWWVLTPQGLITPAAGTPGRDFSTVKVFAGQDFAFKFVKDLDDDALESDFEALYRSIDSDIDDFTSGDFGKDGKTVQTAGSDSVPDSRDTDHDGIDDGVEIYGFFKGNKRVGWTIRPEDGQDAYKTSANPSRADTDLDGLTDCQELGLCDITVWADKDGLPTIDQEKVQEAVESGNPLAEIATFRRGDFQPVDDAPVTIIDDGDPGFFTFGANWSVNGNAGFNGDHRLVEAPIFSELATWEFLGLEDGQYRVSATWTANPVLDAAAPFTVSVGAADERTEILKNQQETPNDFSADGTNWEYLGGVHEVVDGILRVFLWSGDEPVIADAVRLEQLTSFVPRPTDPSKADTDGDGLTDGQEIAGFAYVTLDGKTSGADVPETNVLLPCWVDRVDPTDPDEQLVYDCDSGHKYATNPLHRDTDSDGFPDRHEIRLGTNPTFNDREDVLDDDGDGLVNRQETLGWDVIWTGKSIIIDDGDRGFEFLSDRGRLVASEADGYNGDYHYSNGGPFEDGAVYRFSELPSGTFAVFATWPQVPDAAADARFTVQVNGVDHYSPVDQSVAPDGLMYQGTEWDLLQSASGLLLYTVEQGDRVDVFVQSTGSGTVIADAILLAFYGEYTFIQRSATSRRDPDSDDDGLTDWEEFMGCHDRDGDLLCDDPELQADERKRWGPTNPARKDTDGDGLTDREEVEGFDFAGDKKVPYRFTDPLHWDTDGDGRSDGQEALDSWVVKIPGQPNRTVYSDPTNADGDEDGLEDGREFTLKSDPGNADTDGDGALDGVEADRASTCVSLGELCLSTTSVVVPDRWVTVEFVRLTVGKGTILDGDDIADEYPEIPQINKGAGNFTFEFSIEYPESSEVGTDQTTAKLTDQDMVIANVCNSQSLAVYYEHGCHGVLEDVLKPSGEFYDHTYIQIRESQSIEVLRNKGGLPRSRRTFAVPNGDFFTIKGEVIEWDFDFVNNTNRAYRDSSYVFGGIGSPDGSFFNIEVGTQGIVFDNPLEGPPIEVQVIIRAV